jgi:hypothetical protein
VSEVIPRFKRGETLIFRVPSWAVADASFNGPLGVCRHLSYDNTAGVYTFELPGGQRRAINHTYVSSAWREGSIRSVPEHVLAWEEGL